VPPAERRALLLLLALAVAGQGVRLWLGGRGAGGPPGEVRFSTGVSPGSLAAHRDSAAHAGQPLRPGERIDLDRAGASELARLPRVGPGLARRIVADRTARGPFGSLVELSRVPGVGEGLIAAVREYVVFSAGKALKDSLVVAGGREGGNGVPGTAPEPPAAVNLNVASVAELEKLPGIGPSIARRIVEYRDRHGPFVSVDSLSDVWGIGPRLVDRLRDLVIVR
jgi:competence protein ComEA